ncbi:peptidase S24/S26A/S26B/S26C [Dendryphion nanum]|uniref:Mitochondrial inner membrane protease subunit n=1 Tax=Dendryphion nanum TaxID=256645 RepID=A0A9P9DYN3_9PLEO|nr:peptidase S24/S26A/S26B/S26C [Dendryphion nanum]
MPPKPPLPRVPIPYKRTPPRRAPPTTTSTSTSTSPKPLLFKRATEIPSLSHKSHKPTSIFRLTASTALTTFALALFFRDSIASLDTVNGSSMAPTLSPYAHETGARDRILISRIGISKFPVLALQDVESGWGGVQRGDVVTFWKPYRAGEVGVKRVVGVAGDTIVVGRREGVEGRYGDGEQKRAWGLDGLTDWRGEEGGIDGLVSTTREKEVEGEIRIVVPHGHVWVEGDNWRRSYDSRDFGPISLGLVDGKAVAVWREWWRLRGVDALREERGKKREDGVGRSRVVEGEGSKVPEIFEA